MRPRLHVERLFRETPGVHFSDIWVKGQNGLDLVHHKGKAISPPVDGGKQWYVHKHQTDINRVIWGRRVFELFYTGFMHPRWYVMLDEETGGLEIPPGCLHRSVSCAEGSILLNQAIRDEEFDEKQEFFPVFSVHASKHEPRFLGNKEMIIKFLRKNGDIGIPAL
mgnify:CR=1 FL=1